MLRFTLEKMRAMVAAGVALVAPENRIPEEYFVVGFSYDAAGMMDGAICQAKKSGRWYAVSRYALS